MIETKRWDLQNNMDNSQMIEEAAELLKKGEVVAFPTETVYGLGADATNEKAVARIFRAKGRPQDNPLIAHIATKDQLLELVENIPDYVDKLMETFSPGPITYVLPSNGTCANNVTAGLSTVAVRIPDHPIAQQLLMACDKPIAAPSANISGKPSPTTANHVWDDLAGKIAGIVDGGPTGVGVESTVIDCTEEIPIILRPGGVVLEDIEKVVGHVMVDPALLNHTTRPKAPGMKYTHYAPDVPMWLVEGSTQAIQQKINEQKQAGKRVAVLLSSNHFDYIQADIKTDLGANMKEIASQLYDSLRKFKQSDVDLIICEAFPEQGIGTAVMNRLRKASSEYIKLNN